MVLQVLLLDADSMPLVHPEQLFDDPRFTQYGALFWPDAWTGQARTWAYATYGIDAIRAKVGRPARYSHPTNCRPPSRTQSSQEPRPLLLLLGRSSVASIGRAAA